MSPDISSTHLSETCNLFVFEFSFQTLKTLSNSIDKLKTELSTSGIGLKLEIGGQVPGGVAVKSPEQAKKEILDVELELMTKPSTGEETLELKKKLNELTKVVS